MNNINIKLITYYRSPLLNAENFVDDVENYLQIKRYIQIELFLRDINLNILDKTKLLTNGYYSFNDFKS